MNNMKNFSKNNTSNPKKRSNQKNHLKSNNFSEDKKQAKQFKFAKNNFNSKDESFLSKQKNNKNNHSFDSKRRINMNRSNNFPSRISDDRRDELPNKKNFDDWIWGKHSVFSVLNSQRPINRIWCTSDIFSSEKFYLLLKDFKSKGVLIEEVSWNRLSQLTFGATHQGIAIQLASSKFIPLRKLIELSLSNSTNSIIIALDGITDPHNVGAIIRSAEAFGCRGIILPQRRSCGLTGTVAKVAAGALEHIPVSRVVNLNRAVEELKKNGFSAVGLSVEGQLSISKFKEKPPLLLIIGSEDKGISLITQKKCDYLLKIPLIGKTNSLNASVAAAVSLFHLTQN